MSDEHTVHIYPSDCDSGGHVNHTHMLSLLERARWAALQSHMTFEEYIKRALMAVVRHIEASYSVPSRAGDDFIIRTGLLSVGTTSFTVKQTAHNQRKTLICEAKVVYVTLNGEGKPVPVPQHWRTIFSPWP